MKKIFKSLLLLTMIVLSACTPEEDNLFGESSANRMEATLRANKDILVKATNGWHMEYYPSATQQYGGFNMLVSFTEDGKAHVSSEIYDATDVATSLYSLKQSAGPVLTFDTYNNIMHFFSDPKNPAEVGAEGKGMEGDFEFLFLSVEADKVVLQGKKTGSLIVMTPFKGESWASYIDQIQTADETMSFKLFEYQVNGKKIPVSASYRTLKFTYEKNGEKVSVVEPFIVTPTGYKLYAPLDIEGVLVDEFTFEASSESFIATNGAAAKLVVVYPPLNEVLVTGDWYFAYSDIGAFGAPYWNTAKTALTGIGEKLYYAYMGTYGTGLYGFCFASYDGSSLWGGALGFTSQLIGEDEITYNFASSFAGDGKFYYDYAKFVYLLHPISSSTARTFKLTSDNDKKPTWIKLQDIAIPTNTITLYEDEVNWPFDN